MPEIGSVMILADLQDGYLFWKRETRTYSLTSGPRSPTKMECSGPRSFWLRSARPPPDAQLSLNGRFELGIMEPFRVSALAAAAGLLKSIKQYPALLLSISTHWLESRRPEIADLPRKFVADHLDVNLLTHVVPDRAHEVLVDPRLELTHPVSSQSACA